MVDGYSTWSDENPVELHHWSYSFQFEWSPFEFVVDQFDLFVHRHISRKNQRWVATAEEEEDNIHVQQHMRPDRKEIDGCVRCSLTLQSVVNGLAKQREKREKRRREKNTLHYFFRSLLFVRSFVHSFSSFSVQLTMNFFSLYVQRVLFCSIYLTRQTMTKRVCVSEAAWWWREIIFVPFFTVVLFSRTSHSTIRSVYDYVRIWWQSRWLRISFDQPMRCIIDRDEWKFSLEVSGYLTSVVISL